MNEVAGMTSERSELSNIGWDDVDGMMWMTGNEDVGERDMMGAMTGRDDRNGRKTR